MAHNSSPVICDPSSLDACRFYDTLTRNAPLSPSPEAAVEPGLGGQLLYAGQLDAWGRAFVIAGNVAGCATLSATADAEAGKQSLRDGVVDFLVTSLDEALRILKNEIRQHKSVSVCVGVPPQSMADEMLERGVQPDLVFATQPDEQRAPTPFGRGTRQIEIAEPDASRGFLMWQIQRPSARCMANIDAIALDCLPARSWEKRWIRLSPHYLGRSALAERTLCCNLSTAKQIAGRIGTSVQQGEVEVEVSMRLDSPGETLTWTLAPHSAQDSGAVES